MGRISGDRLRASPRVDAYSNCLRRSKSLRSAHHETAWVYVSRCWSERRRLSLARRDLIRTWADLWDLEGPSRNFLSVTPEHDQGGTLERFYGWQKSASLLFEGAATVGNG